MTLQVGDRAPTCSFTANDGARIELASLLGKGAVVLFFYPKNETSGCTAEACSFRDSHEDFVAAGAQVIGVSSDNAASHESFKANHRLPFTLLTDADGSAAKAFGVKKTLGFIPGRVTFVIDRAGIIKMRFDSQIRATSHAPEALELVKSLAASAPA